MHLLYANTFIAGLFVLSLASDADPKTAIESLAESLYRFIPFSEEDPNVRQELELPQLDWDEEVKKIFTQIGYGGFLCSQSFDRLVATASQLVSASIMKAAHSFEEMPEESHYLADEIAKSLKNDISDASEANNTVLADHVTAALSYIFSMKSTQMISLDRWYDFSRKSKNDSRLKNLTVRFFSGDDRSHLLRMIRFSYPHLALVLGFPEISFKYLGNLVVFELESLADIEVELEKRYSKTGSLVGFWLHVMATLKHRDGSLQAWDIRDIKDLFSAFDPPEFTYGNQGKLTKERVFELISDLGKYISEERFKQQLNDLELLGVNQDVLKELKSPEAATAELSRFSSQLLRAQRENTNIYSSYWDLERDLAEENSNAASLRQQLNDLSKKLSSLTANLEKVTRERDELRDEREKLTKQLAARVDPASIDYTIGFLQRNYLQKIDMHKPTNFFFDDDGKVIKTLKERFDPPNLAPLLKTVEDCLKSMESKIQSQYSDLTSTTKTIVSLWTQALPDADSKQQLSSKLASLGFNHETGVFELKSTKFSDFYKLISSFDLKSLVEKAAAKLTAESKEVAERMEQEFQELLKQKSQLSNELEQERQVARQQMEEISSLQSSIKALEQDVSESDPGPSLNDELQATKDFPLEQKDQEELRELKRALEASLELNQNDSSTFIDRVQSSIMGLTSLKDSILDIASQMESTEDIEESMELLKSLPQRHQELEQDNIHLASQLSKVSLERERLSFLEDMIEELKQKILEIESSNKSNTSLKQSPQSPRDSEEAKHSVLLASIGKILDVSNIDDAKALSQLWSLATSLKALKTSVAVIDSSLIVESKDWLQSLSSYLLVNANEWKQIKELKQVIPTLQVITGAEIKEKMGQNPAEDSGSLSYAEVIRKAAETIRSINDEKISLSEKLKTSSEKDAENAKVISMHESRATELQNEVSRLSKSLHKKDEFIKSTFEDLSDEALQTAQNLLQSEELKHENEILRQSIAKISEQANEALLLVKEKDALLARLKQDYSSQAEAIKRATELQLSENQKHLKLMEEKVESQENDIQGARQELEAAKIEKTAFESLEKELEELKLQEVIQKETIKTLQESESQLNDVIIALQKNDALQEVTRRLEKMIQEKADLDTTLVHSQKTIESFKANISSLSSELEVHRQLATMISQRMPAKSDPIEAFNALITARETLERELSNLQATMKSKEAAIHEIESKLAIVEKSNLNMTSQLEANSHLLETYSKIIRQLSGLFSPAASFADLEVSQLHQEVEKTHEQAIHLSQTAIALEQQISEVIQTSANNEKELLESKTTVLILESQLKKILEIFKTKNVEDALIAAQTLNSTIERQAAEFLGLKNDLKPLLDPSSHTMADAVASISDLRTLIVGEIGAKKSESDFMKAALEHIKKEKASLQDDLQKLANERRDILRELGIPLQQGELDVPGGAKSEVGLENIPTKVHLIMQENEKLNAEFKELQERYSTVALELTDAKSTLKSAFHLDSIGDAVEKIGRLNRQNTILQEQLSELQRVARGREALSKSLHEHNVQLEAKIDELISEIALVKAENAKMEEFRKSLDEEKLALKEKLEKANGSLEQLQEKYDSLQKIGEEEKKDTEDLLKKHEKTLSEISKVFHLSFNSEDTLLREAAEIKTIQDLITQKIYDASDDEPVPSWKIVVRQVKENLDEFALMKASVTKIGELASELSGNAITASQSDLSPLKELNGLESSLKTIRGQIQEQEYIISKKEALIQDLNQTIIAKELEVSKAVSEFETFRKLQQASNTAGSEVLASQIAHLTAVTETLNGEKQLLQNQIAIIKDNQRQELENLQQQIQRHMSTEKELQESNSKLAHEISNLKKTLELQRLSLTEQQLIADQLRDDYASVKTSHDKLESSLKVFLRDKIKLEPEQSGNQDYGDTFATLEVYLSDVTSEKKLLIEEVARAQEEKTTVLQHHGELVEELQEILPQVTPLNVKIFAASFKELTEAIKTLQPLTFAVDGMAGLKASLSLAKSKLEEVPVIEVSLVALESTMNSLMEDLEIMPAGIPGNNLDSSPVSLLKSIKEELELFKVVHLTETQEKRNLQTEIQKLTSELELAKASAELAKNEVHVLSEAFPDDLKAQFAELSHVNSTLAHSLEASKKELEILKSSNDRQIRELKSKSEEIWQQHKKVADLEVILEETQTALHRYQHESQALVSSLEDQLKEAHISEKEAFIKANLGNQFDSQSVTIEPSVPVKAVIDQLSERSSKSIYDDRRQNDLPHRSTGYWASLSDTKTFWDNRSLSSHHAGRQTAVSLRNKCLSIMGKFQKLEKSNNPDLVIDNECWPYISDDLISKSQDFQVARIITTQWSPRQLQLVQPEAIKYLRIDKWRPDDHSIEMCNALSKDQIFAIKSNAYMKVHYERVCVNG